MNELIGLGFTLLAGLFIVVGFLIVFFSKNSNRFIHLSISIAFGVMMSLVILELIPEVFTIFNDKFSEKASVSLMIVIIGLGIMLLNYLDKFIPDHSTECDGDCDNDSNFYHIGIVATLSLLIHQIIEGMAIFGSVANSISLTFLLVLGIGLHSIPLGMIISSTIYKATNSIKKTMIFILSLVFAPFIGGLIILFNSNLFNDEFVLGMLLALTAGMLLYISLFELLPHLKHESNKKTTIIGIIIGIILMLISMML